MKTSRSSVLVAVALCAGLAITAPHQAAAMGTSGAATVQSFYDTLLNTMRNASRLGIQGRVAQLAPAIRQSFDIPFMTQLAVGPSWNSIDAGQKAQVTQAFERYIAAVYAERFDSYEGEQLKVIGEQASPGGTMITSQIIKSNGEPVHINYLMRQSGAGWQIADVYLNGTISEVATRRSEFSTILRTSGVDGLIAALNAKTASLGVRTS